MDNKKELRYVEVYTRDRFLFQKIRLSTDAVVTNGKGEGVHPLILVDIDTQNAPSGNFLSMSRQRDADLKIPFPTDAVNKLLSSATKEVSGLVLSEGERSAFLRGEKIKLTEVEYLLLSVLFSAGGKYVEREKILDLVWGGDADSGVINVYVHYLREKLERYGEKIIISSRKCGYKIDEKYLDCGGDTDA